MHSCTKFMGGHSDVLLGCLSTNHEMLAKKLRSIQKYRGATPGSFDCYLLHRSLQTLEVSSLKMT
jgi:cystathionine beta-lyase/cystathionine gamma-synthase